MQPTTFGARRFVLHRVEDETGVSGTGDVAEGTLFADGKAVLHWLTDVSSVAVYDSVDDLIAIHGHGGRTVIRWVDQEAGAASGDGDDMYRRAYFDISDVLDTTLGGGSDAGAGYGIAADVRLLAQWYADLREAVTGTGGEWPEIVAGIEARPLCCDHGVPVDEDCTPCLEVVRSQLAVGAEGGNE